MLQGRRMHYIDDNDEFIVDISKTPSFSSNMSTLNVEKEVDDVYAIRDDQHKRVVGEHCT